MVAIPLALLVAAAPPIGIPIAVLAMLALMAAASACSGVFSAALYRYAVGGQGVGVFSREDLDAAFRPKRGEIDTRPPMPPRPDGNL